MILFAVDDRPRALTSLANVLRAAKPDAEVHEFISGADALDAARTIPCDAAFLDIDMPEMSGIELGRQLKLIHPATNIIFATGYQEYALDALQMHASGYLLKPITPEKVREELNELRHPVIEHEKRVRFQCFGNFEVFIDGRPVPFKRQKTKEYLAYLVDRGTMCSNEEIAAVLWDKDTHSAYLRQLRKDLWDTFSLYNCLDVLIQSRKFQGIRADLVSCDYYDWKKGLPAGLNAYRGEYMAQYAWAEMAKGTAP